VNASHGDGYLWRRQVATGGGVVKVFGDALGRQPREVEHLLGIGVRHARSWPVG